MGRIRVLEDGIINQIAAGEVIENPSSVVKELVENAIDAGASEVVIETKAGGLQLIRIVDNGSGMEPDDALLCLERHATSKIVAVEDLFALSTMGFRGEALASIASISKMTLLTHCEKGSHIEVEGGKILSVRPCARTQGTTIEVRSLFYNVPARKKFQKSASICASEVARIVSLLSLGFPQVGIELIQQDRASLIAKSAETLLERMQQVLGEAFCQELCAVSYKEKGIELTGYIGKPSHNRHNRTGQYLYINKRAVVSPLISSSVRDGYGTRLASDRYPIFVLHVDLFSEAVDVNVHPQKKEVRIKEEIWLKEVIRKAVSFALQQDKPASIIFSSLAKENFSFSEPCPTAYTSSFILREDPIQCESKELPLALKPRMIGVYAHFLFLESPEGEIIFLDLHAALSQIVYDKLFNPIKKVSQTLLIPLTLELPHAEAERVRAHQSLCEEMGFSIRPLGGQAFIIDAIPPFLDPEDAREAIREMGETLRGDIREEKLKKMAKIASSYAKKKIFSVFEAEAIYNELLATSSPQFSPDGKPTMLKMSKEALASRIESTMRA